MIKNILLIITLTLVINSCITSRGLELSQSKASQAGWIENSESPSANREMFFLRKLSTASDTAKAKKSGSKMQESCIASAQETAKMEIISELSKVLALNSGSKEKQFSLIESSIRNINIRECQPIGEKNKEIPFSEWGACECVFYAKVNGGKDAFLSKLNDL